MIILAIAIFWLLYNIGKSEIERKNNLKELENRFLIGMTFSETYKNQILSILKIVYEKAAETDEQFVKDYEKIVEATEKKFEQFGDEWIKNMNITLGHKTEYQNWREATRYIERLLKTNGHEINSTERD